MSGEAIFLSEDILGANFLIMNLLATVFLLLALPLTRIRVVRPVSVVSDIERHLSWILLVALGLLFFVFMINTYLVLKAGGLYEFYFGNDWHSRYESGGPLMVVIMNLKSILPCLGAGLAAALLVSTRYRLISGLLLFLFILLLVFGGSNRKFALLAVFIYFIVSVDVLGKKRARSVFYGMAGFMFLLFQALLFLRSSSFDAEALVNAFSTMGDVVLTSEPIGTYSVNLMLLGKILSGDIVYGNFYDVFKFGLIPFSFVVDYVQPNVAWVLGGHVNDVAGFTFFPTLLIEGMYNGGVLGFLMLSGAFIYLSSVIVKRVGSSLTLFGSLYWVSIYSMCLLQMIRGYSSVCIAYFLITTFIFLAARIFSEGWRSVCCRS